MDLGGTSDPILVFDETDVGHVVVEEASGWSFECSCKGTHGSFLGSDEP